MGYSRNRTDHHQMKLSQFQRLGGYRDFTINACHLLHGTGARGEVSIVAEYLEHCLG